MVEPLTGLVGDHDLVIMPSGALAGVPWGVLPGTAGRSVTVTPSASSWLAARIRRPADASGGGTLLVGGPGLAHAEPEVRAIAELRRDSRVLLGEASTSSEVLSALDGADTIVDADDLLATG